MAAARNLGLGWFRDSRAEGTVWASAIVMDRPFTKNAAYVAFSQRNEVVQTLPADRADKPFAKRIGCWTANRSFQDADAETGEFMVQAHGEDGIPVVNEKSVRMVAGQCLAELLERPCRCRMIGDVHMKQAARADLIVAIGTVGARLASPDTVCDAGGAVWSAGGAVWSAGGASPAPTGIRRSVLDADDAPHLIHHVHLADLLQRRLH